MEKNKVITICLAISFVAISTMAFPFEEKKEPFPVNTEESCINSSCHTEHSENLYIHDAASDGYMCIECHDLEKPGIHSFKLKENKSQLCLMCHSEEILQGRDIHGPVSEGNCLDCHDPHGSNYPNHLYADEPELCLNCHDVKTVDQNGKQLSSFKNLFNDEKTIVHGALKNHGKCTICHLAHPGNTFRRLNEQYPSEFYTYDNVNNAYSLCLVCHEKFIDTLDQRVSVGTGFRNGTDNLHYLHIVRTKSRSCRTCHDPHGSTNEKLIRKTFLFGNWLLPIGFEKKHAGGTCKSFCHAEAEYDRDEAAPNELLMSQIKNFNTVTPYDQ